MRGRWAAGIEPRNFAWILMDQLAVSERPGGFAPHHRRVRRQEEILWLNAHGFTRIVSLLPSSHNLKAYEEHHIPAVSYALPTRGDARPVLSEVYATLFEWLQGGERVLVHQDELGEQVAGVVAGFLCWSRLLPEPPRAVSAVEHLLRRQMGHAGRSIVALAADMPAGPPWRPTAGRGTSGPAAPPTSPRAAPAVGTRPLPSASASGRTGEKPVPPTPPAGAPKAAPPSPAETAGPSGSTSRDEEASRPVPARTAEAKPSTNAPEKVVKDVPEEAAPARAAPRGGGR